MPDAPPVTIATFPSKSRGSLSPPLTTVGPSIVITGSSVIIHTKASESRKLCSSGATIVAYSGAATKASKSAAESNHWIVMPS